MRNTLITVATIALTSVLSSTGASAHVAGGALTDGAKKPVKSSYAKCIVVADGRFSSKCHDVKAKVVAKPAPTSVAVSQAVSFAGDALFSTNSDELSAAGKATLDDFSARASAIKVSNVKVVGHADSRGDEGYNQGLSERRAVSVKSHLVEKGLESYNISTSGEGESSPVASNDTAAGRAQNRRVDITVTGTSK
ncbi:MAG: OOP family OmpA-OmpF porin [Candidatus Endobugula sp.]|jgi:OOP family OmpA-OmpF porin